MLDHLLQSLSIGETRNSLTPVLLVERTDPPSSGVFTHDQTLLPPLRSDEMTPDTRGARISCTSPETSP